jgi:hypothetical protein
LQPLVNEDDGMDKSVLVKEVLFDSFPFKIGFK